MDIFGTRQNYLPLKWRSERIHTMSIWHLTSCAGIYWYYGLVLYWHFKVNCTLIQFAHHLPSYIFRYVDRNVLESDQRKALLFETFFVWMNFIEGIPIAILNLIVFASIIIIVKSPSGACISSCSTKSRATTSKN